MKVFSFLFFLCCLFPVMLQAQDPVMTYEMKLTRVYCGIPVNKDPYGPDPRYRINARLRGLGTNINNNVFVSLNNLQTTGWIDIDDQVVVSGTLVPGSRTIDLCNTGIDVVFDDLDAWEENFGESDGLEAGDGFPLQLSSFPGPDDDDGSIRPTGRPESGPGPGIAKTIVVMGSDYGDPNSPFGFEFTVVYTLENVLQRVEIAGNAAGEPVAELCAGGNVYLQGVLADNFTGGVIRYEKSGDAGTNWGTIGDRSSSRAIEVEYTGFQNDRYRASLVVCMRDEKSKPVDFSNIKIFPSIQPSDITFITATTCQDASEGSVTVNPITGLDPSITYVLQLKRVNTSGIVFDDPEVESPMLPYTFENVPAGPYIITVSSNTMNATGGLIGDCGADSERFTIDAKPAPAITLLEPTNASCETPSGTVRVGAATGDFTVALYSTENPDTPVSGPVAPNAGTEHVFTDVMPGNYFVSLRQDGNGCARRSELFTISAPVNRASGSWAPDGNALTVNCTGETIAVDFTPDTGTGTNEVTLTALNVLLGGGDSQVFQRDVSAGSSTSANLRQGDYAVNFRRLDDTGCDRTYFFTVASNFAPMEVTLNMQTGPTECTPNSGEAVIDVSGGSPGYMPEIQGADLFFTEDLGNGTIRYTFTGLTGGSYTFQVTDTNGCVAIRTLNIPNPAMVNVQADLASSRLAVDCFGDTDGSIQLVGTGLGNLTYRLTAQGTTPGDFGTQTLFENLAAGTYLAEIQDDANGGCIASQSIAISEPDQLEILDVSYVTRYQCDEPTVDIRIKFNYIPDLSYCAGDNFPCRFDVSFLHLGPDAGFEVGSASAPLLTAPDAPFQEIILRDQQPGNFEFAMEVIRFVPLRVVCGSAPVSFTATPEDPLFIEITDKTDPSCYEAYDGSITLKYGGGDPGGIFDIDLYVSTGPSDNTGFMPVSLPNFSYTYSKDSTITIAGLPSITAYFDLANIPQDPSTFAYFARIRPGVTFTGASCIVQSHEVGGPPEELVRLVSPGPLSFSAGFTKGLECDGSGAVFSISNPTGGTPPYEYSLVAGVGSTTTLYDFSPQTTFDISGDGPVAVIMRDSRDCVYEDESDTTPGYEPTQEYGVSFTPTPIGNGECPPELGEFLTGIMRVNGGLGLTTYTFSTDGVAAPAAITTADSVIFLSGMQPGTVTVFIDNPATGEHCQTATFENPAPPLPLSLTVETIQGESCPGAGDAQVRLLAEGGVGTLTFIYRGVETGFPPGSPAVLDITNATSGSIFVGVYDTNDCYIDQEIDIPTSPGAMLIGVLTQDETPCPGTGNGVLTVDLFGGVGPYQFDWLDDAEPPFSVVQDGLVERRDLTRQRYDYRIESANGCIVESYAWVGGRDPLQAEIVDVVQPGCSPTGSFRINITQNSSPPSSNIMASINGGPRQSELFFDELPAGNYIVRVFDDANCQQDGLLSVELTIQDDDLSIAITPTDASCSGESDGQIVAQAAGGTPPYQYTITGSPPVSDGVFTGLVASTYNVSVTDAAGCSTTSEPIVISDSDPVAGEWVSSTNSCVGGSTGSVTLAGTSGRAPFSYRMEGGIYGPDPVFTDLAPGTYQFQLRDADDCESALIGAPVGQLPLFSVEQGAIVAATCNTADGSSTVNVVGGNDGYSFAWPDGQTGPTATNLLAGAYDVIVTSAAGCSQTFTATVNSSGGPTISLFIGNDACESGSGSITVSVSSGTPPYNYAWSDDTNRNEATATGLSEGDYTVTVNDNVGCSSQATATVTTTPGISLSLVSSTPNSCGLDNGTAILTSTGGIDPVTYSWSHDLTADGLTVSNLPNTVDVIVTATSSNGCTDQLTIPATNSIGLQGLTGTVEATSCGQDDGQITLTPVGGTSPFTYTWSHTSTLTTNQATNLAVGTYTVNVTDVNGCSLERDFTVTSSSPIVLGTNNVTPSDCGLSNGSINVGVSGNTNSVTYGWSHDASITGQFAAGLSAGDYSITVTEDGTGCTASIDVTVPGSPNGASMTVLSLTNTSCGLDNGALEVLPAFGTPPFNYRWSHTDTLDIATAINLAAGTYSVTSTDAEDCTSEGSFTIAPSNAAQIFLQNSTPTACGQANGSLTVDPGFVPDPIFRWSHNSNLDGPLAENLSGGDYTVTVTGSDGCSVEATYNVANTGFNELEATGTNVGCEEGSGTASVTVLNGTPPFTYDWEHAPDENISGFVGLNSGTYNVTVTDATGCSGQASVVVPLPAPPGLSVVSNTESCNGLDDGSVTLAGTSGLAPFMYRIAGGTYDPSPIFSGLAPGDYQFQMRAANGCESDLLEVTIDATVEINVLSVDDDTCENGFGSITVQAAGGTPPYTYAWSDDLDRTVSFANSLSAGTYTITATDETGCRNQRTVELGSTPGITVSLVSSTSTACGQASGTATVTTTGGIETIMYAWSHDPMANGPTVNNLPGGISTVTVTSANGCTDELNIFISSAGGIGLINGSAQATTCGLDNGQVTAEPIGGAAPFTYVWSHTDTLEESPAINLAPGDYTVTITDDNGCGIDRTFTIAPSTNPLSVQIVSQEPSDCATPNGNITLETTGNVNGVRYDWSHDPNINGNFAFGLAAGDYSVTVTENGPRCSVVLNYTIEGAPGGAFLTDLSRTPTSCGLDNGSLTVEPTSGNAPFTYRWSHTDTLVIGTAINLAPGTYSVTATDADGCTSNRSFPINDSPTPTVVLLIGSSADCGQANGSLNVFGTSLPNPMYTWSHDPDLNAPLAENLIGGDYTVTITGSDDCVAERTFTVENVGFLTVTATPTNSLCEDGNGAVDVTVADGTPPYTYAWEHAPGENVAGFTNLNSGLYQVTVTDAAGCTGNIFTSVNVVEPPTLTVFTQVHTSCGQDNGFLYVSASGGLRPYTFDWAEITDQTSGQTNGFDGIFDLAAGDYNLTVTDANGCTVSGTYTIDGSAPVTVSVTTQVNPTGGANNGAIIISTTGFVPPLTYFWSHDDNLQGSIAANLSAGNYTVGVQDANLCYDEVTVVLNSGLIAELINVNNPVCTDDTGTAEVNVLTGTAPYSYAWSHAPGEDVPSFDNLSEGSYNVLVSDATGATFELSFELEFEGGFSELFSFSDPASCGQDNGILEVFPGDGEFPFTYNWADFPGLNENRLTDLAIGDYAVTVTDGQGCSLSRVFTVEPAPEPELIIDYIFQPTDGMADGEVGVVTSGFTEPITYSWSHDPNINSPFLEDIPAGTYTLTVTDDLGCTEMITIEVGVPIVVAQAINLRDAGCTNDDGEATILVTIGQFPYSYEWSHAPGQNVNSFDNLAGGDYMVTVGDDAGAMTVVSFSIDFLSGPTAIVATANEGTTCGESNAVLTVAPVDGNPPFEYEWVGFPDISGPTLTDLPPGDYTLSIFDNQNCSFTETFTVAGSAVPAVSLDEQVNPTGGLANGSISITTTGFTAPLTYQWSHDNNINAPLAENLTAGSYTVSVSDDNGCTDELTVVLTEGLIAEIINLSNSVCTDDNGTAEVNVLSGTAPFNYEWSHAPGINVASFSDLARGNYTVTVTDANNATFGLDFFVGLELGPIAINSTINEGTICGENNGSLNVSPVGGTAPFTFGWSHDTDLDNSIATNLAAGDYVVTITDANNCFIADTFTIDGSATPTLSVSSQTDPSCGEGNGQISVLAEGFTAPLTYAWSHDTDLEGPTASGLAPGEYTIEVSDVNDCTASIMLTLSGQDALATSLSERSDAICEDGTGSATISVVSGTEPFLFEWSHAPGVNVDNFSDLVAGDYEVMITDNNGCTDTQTFSIAFIAGPAGVTVISQQATTCGEDNGSLEVAPEGGTGPYTFAWAHDGDLDTGVATNLAAGDYEVTITDVNGCPVADVFTIDGSATPTLSVSSQTDPSCGEGNGQISVLAEGFTAPLTYAWSHDTDLEGPTASGLAPGEYTIEVSDVNDCTASIMLTLSGQDALATSLSERSDAICEDGTGSATISVVSGTEPFLFEWSHAPGVNVDNFSDLVAGDYEVMITDNNGCTDTQTFSIAFIAGPAGVTVISQQATTCGEDNGSLEVAPEGGTGPYTFAWAHDGDLDTGVATNLAAGDYEVTITDVNGCPVADVFTIDGSATPTLSVSSQTDPSCGEGNGQISVLAEGFTAPLTYAWSHDTDLEGPTASGLAPGEYTIEVSDVNDCTASIMLTLSGQDALATSLSERSDAICEDGTGSATISVVSGTEPFLFEWSHAPGVNVDNFSDLVAGDYEVMITDNNGCTDTQTFSIAFIAGPAGVTVISQQATTCGEDNGSLEVAPEGGTGPYTFAWAHDGDLDTGVATNLAAGDYEVTITDVNGCPVADVFTIDGSATPTLSVSSQTDPSCGEGNGQISVLAEGFTAPLTYAWSHDTDLEGPTASGLAPGEYTIEVSDVNDCTASIMLTLSGQDALATSLSERSDAICEDGTGSATISVVSGTEPFLFEWSHAPGVNVDNFSDLVAGDYEVMITDNNGCTDTQTFSIAFIAGPAGVTVISQQATTCGEDNGSLEVAPEGGTGPYTFAWAHDGDLDTGVATNLAAGDYVVTITDANNCFIADTFTIDGSATPTLSGSSQTDPSCGEDNGQISVLAEGFTAPLTYAWSHDTDLEGPTASGLTPGEYTIEVSDVNDCTASIMLTLSGQDALATSLSERSDAICEDGTGSATISVVSGTEPFLFEWSHAPGVNVDNFSDLVAGDYEVMITDDKGCMDTQTFSIAFIAGPAGVTVISQQATTCGEDNGSLEVAPEGGTDPYTFAWAHDGDLDTGVATNLAAGDYEVTITDVNGCPVADVFTIDGSATPTLSVSSQTDPSCGEDNGQISVLAEGFTAPLTYAWSHDTDLEGPTASGLAPGEYTIEVSDVNDCTASIMLTLSGQDALATSLSERSDAICEDGTGSATISVVSGTEPFLFEWSHAPGVNVDNFSDLVAGDYEVMITDDKGCMDTQTFSIAFIAGPAGVTVISQQATTCGEDNGSLEVAPEGGTDPYTFAWAHDGDLDTGVATNLAAGDYEVTITDVNGCPVADVFTIDGSATPTLSVSSQTDPSCGEDNGQISVLAEGFTAPLTYLWSHDTDLEGPTASGLAPGEYTIEVSDVNDCTASIMLTLSGQDALATSLSERSDAICEDGTGSATISVVSGTEPFLFEWSHAPGVNVDNFSDLVAGDYEVMITDDKGCMDTQTFSIAFIAGPAGVTVISQQATTCGEDNGSLEVAPEGGTDPYTFAWAHDGDLDTGVATNLAAGDYEVTITDVNGCPVADVFTIDGSATPTLSVSSQTDPSCGEDNGQISVLAEGFTAPLTYAWSHDTDLEGPTASGLAPGEYTIEVSDVNDCTASIMLTLSGQDALATSLSERSDAICEDGTGSATISVVSGTEPFLFEWSHAPGVNVDNFSDLVAGDYEVMITDNNGCTDTQTFSIAFIAGPAGVTVISQQATTCGEDNGSLEVAPEGGTGPYTFAWAHDDDLTNDLAVGLAPGQYEVTITDVNGCPVADVYTIDESERPEITLEEVVNANCGENNGSVLVSVSGLTTPLTFEWSHDMELDGPLAEGLGGGNYSVTITGDGGCRAETTASVSSQDGPAISISSIAKDTCGAETGAILISYDGGGTDPFFYNWSHDTELNSNTATGLPAGTYGITLTDAVGCVAALTATVETEISALLPEFTLAPATCAQNDGQATVEPQGGRGPYFYFWSHDSNLSGPTATNVPEGNHSITIIDQNGCMETADFQIGEPTGPEEVVLIANTPTTCGEANGALEVSALGGTTPYTFSWSHDETLTAGTASGLPAATYEVTVIDANHCTTSTTLTIGESEMPTASIVQQTDPGCNLNNGSITVTTTGLTEPLFYEWAQDSNLNAPTAGGLGAGDYEVTVTGSNGCMATVGASLNESQSFTAAIINLANTRCDDGNGAATVEVTDGVEPITYTWSHAAGQNVDGFTNLAAGDYSVVVSDGSGCSDTLTFSINLIEGPTAIEVTNFQATTCGLQNGSLSVTPIGGTGLYNYNWADFPGVNSGELTDLAAGDYSLTVTDENNCSVSETFTVAPSEAPTASVDSQTDSNCGQSNGSATISTTGLTAPLFYLWSHDSTLNAATAEGLAAGAYSVTITGTNDCTVTESIAISNTNGPTISLASAVNERCGEANGSISTNYEGGGTEPFTYRWSHDNDLNAPAAEDLEAGTYEVTITDVNNCSDVLSVDLINLAGPESLTAASLTPTICGEPNGALTVEVAGGTAPFTYSWNHDTTITGDRATELDSGVYRVVVTDANGCTTSNTFSIPSSIGLAITADEVVGANCNMENGSILISVANATGEVTYVWNHNTTLNTPMLTDLPAGNYMVTVTDEAGCSTEGIFMVESLDNPASFTITASPSNCEDGQGSIAVSITDGRPPYRYLWSHDNTLNVPVVSGLTEGDYNVLVTDVLGCQVLLEASVVLTEGPDATVVTTEPGCAGATNGSLTAMPTGGTTPYTYLWSNTAVTASISDAAAGAYSVTITDANGCTTTADAMLVDGPPVVITLLDSIPPSCAELADGRLEVEASGGSAPYSFNWSEGTNAALAEGLSAGVTYSVTVTSAEGCLAEMSYSMPNVLPLSLPIPADTTLCQDDIWALDLTAYTNTLVTGPNGFSNNETVVLIDEAGTYTVVATGASGCSGTAEVVVNFTGQTFVAGMVLPSDVVAGDSVVVLETSWPAPNSVEWIFDRSGARQVAQLQNQHWFIFDEVGEYNLSLLASFGGCDDLITKGLTVHADSTSIPSIGLTRSGIEDVVISPNPNNGRFNAEVTLSTVDRVFLNLYDLDGTPIDRQEDTGSSNYTFSYDLNLQAGSYLLLVQTGSARRTVVIIVSD